MRKPVFFLAMILLLCGLGMAQTGHTGPGSSRGQNPTDPQFGRDRNQASPEEQRFERERQKQANKQRQATIQKDTDQLLELASELKQYVDKTNENVLSLDVMKKAEQIEKLARQIREKMKNSP